MSKLERAKARYAPQPTADKRPGPWELVDGVVQLRSARVTRVLRNVASRSSRLLAALQD